MKLIYRIVLIIFFLLVLSAIIAFARGYRFDVEKQNVTSNGILAIAAYPKAAKVYINGELKGVSDINLTLPNGTYNIEVKKDGYTSWQKSVSLKGELVLTLDVLLYPLNPSLSPLSNVGVTKAIALQQADKIILFSESDTGEKDGIYLFDLSKNPLSFFPPLKLIILKKVITDSVGEIDFKDVRVEVSPDNKEAIFTFQIGGKTQSFLLSLENENTNVFDISSSNETLVEAWTSQRLQVTRKILEAYPKEIAKVATDSFDVVEFSPDETKVLYLAKKSLTLPQVVVPALIAVNQTPQERILNEGGLYVYDKKEDKNYSLVNYQLPTTNYISWYSDSKHLVFNEGNKISVIDYDGLNKQTIYSGPYDGSLFKVTIDGKIIILTNLNPQANRLPDLYSVGIR